ncbi:MAG: hypothetical protein ACI82N_000378, partial [Maricaulis sp.]
MPAAGSVIGKFDAKSGLPQRGMNAVHMSGVLSL